MLHAGGPTDGQKEGQTDRQTDGKFEIVMSRFLHRFVNAPAINTEDNVNAFEYSFWTYRPC